MPHRAHKIPRIPHLLHARPLLSALILWFALLCVLTPPAQAQGQPVLTPLDQTRTSSFTYFGAADGVKNGLLQSETVEPDKADYCVTTTYSYDNYGNKTGSSTDRTNCAGSASATASFVARGAGSVYGTGAETFSIGATTVTIAQGSFATVLTNALNHSETRSYDPRFGAALSLKGPNNLTTTWTVDHFGRKTKELRADGTSTVTAYCLISSKFASADLTSNSDVTANGDPLTCPAPAVATAEAPTDAVSFTHSEPWDKNGIKNGPIVRVYMDALGRKLRTVTEGFNPNASAAGEDTFIYQDIEYSAYGVQILVTQPYFAASGSSTSAGATHYGMTRTDVDALGRVTASYSTDPADPTDITNTTGGKAGSVGFGLNNNRGLFQASVVSVTYAGMSTTTINDLGQTRVEVKNVDGKPLLITDHLRAQVVGDEQGLSRSSGS